MKLDFAAVPFQHNAAHPFTGFVLVLLRNFLGSAGREVSRVSLAA